MGWEKKEVSNGYDGCDSQAVGEAGDGEQVFLITYKLQVSSTLCACGARPSGLADTLITGINLILRGRPHIPSTMHHVFAPVLVVRSSLPQDGSLGVQASCTS
ncbi:unnamed protein product [Tilletia controversa]|nr:unnamed protein product [Tilletia controversa]CAD6945397.1 unnamed protein product [Tilletia controversa]